MKKLLYLLITAVVLASCLKQKPDVPPPPTTPPGGGIQTVFEWDKIADSSQNALNLFYATGGKFYTTTNTSTNWVNYWPSAHTLDVLVDAYIRNSSPAIKTKMNDLLTGMYAKNGNTWLNYYYDDMEWMALACLRAYKATGDVAFKNITDVLWSDIKSGWSSDLGGGIWWRKDNSSKNTPSNMPAAILAARLYREFNKPEDLQWAQQIYNWQKAVLYDNSNGLVWDNIEKNGTKNTSWKFTYNQGTFLGAAMELYKITNNTAYLDDAYKAADYTLNSGFLTANGVLKDEGGGDGGLFKGVFVRYFTRMIIDGGINNNKKQNYLSFMKTNAETLWVKGTNKNSVLFGSAWDKIPGSTVDFTVQLSGMMMIEAAAELKKLNLF
jgi:predicted alpha-1,6-mannanase (GH76 family)